MSSLLVMLSGARKGKVKLVPGRGEERESEARTRKGRGK
ncbi:unnamed protein product, partial (mitochondrion) [Musa textilis]